MEDIAKLRLAENVSLDRDQLEILIVQHGPTNADDLVSRAMEDLAVVLARVEKCHHAGRIEDVRAGVKQLITLSQKVGMTSLARVARDVLHLSQGQDSVAYCAVMERLVRIGEGSLVAVWDLQGMSI